MKIMNTRDKGRGEVYRDVEENCGLNRALTLLLIVQIRYGARWAWVGDVLTTEVVVMNCLDKSDFYPGTEQELALLKRITDTLQSVSAHPTRLSCLLEGFGLSGLTSKVRPQVAKFYSISGRQVELQDYWEMLVDSICLMVEGGYTPEEVLACYEDKPVSELQPA